MAESAVLTALREAILSLDLSPGELLSERGLEPRLNASRTPIRAALTQLSGEGLVQRDGRGWIVAPLDLDELATLTEYREVLETAGARLAIQRASDEELGSLSRLLPSLAHAEDPEEGVGSGTNFHHAVAALSGNEHLISALDGVLMRLYRTRWLEVRSAESRARANREHEAIVAGMLNRDAEAAEIAIRKHLGGTMDRLRIQLNKDRQAMRARGVHLAGRVGAIPT
jgi:DNA-binding GntR family transcriptional regulator